MASKVAYREPVDPGMKKTFASEFLYNPDKSGQHCHSATLMEAAGGDLFAGWYAYREQEYQGGHSRPGAKTVWRNQLDCQQEYPTGAQLFSRKSGPPLISGIS